MKSGSQGDQTRRNARDRWGSDPIADVNRGLHDGRVDHIGGPPVSPHELPHAQR